MLDNKDWILFYFSPKIVFQFVDLHYHTLETNNGPINVMVAWHMRSNLLGSKLTTV